MPRLPGRLGTLTAGDVMTRKVITLTESDTIEKAVHRLKKKRITGAPVVDEAGKFVGILSISDLLSRSGTGSGETEAAPFPLAHGEDAAAWDLFERARSINEDVSSESVGSRMSKQVTSVTENAPLVEVARVMCSGHWHRVPVVDDNGSLVGIISTMDILAAVVNTADEQT